MLTTQHQILDAMNAVHVEVMRSLPQQCMPHILVPSKRDQTIDISKEILIDQRKPEAKSIGESKTSSPHTSSAIRGVQSSLLLLIREALRVRVGVNSIVVVRRT